MQPRLGLIVLGSWEIRTWKILGGDGQASDFVHESLNCLPKVTLVISREAS